MEGVDLFQARPPPGRPPAQLSNCARPADGCQGGARPRSAPPSASLSSAPAPPRRPPPHLHYVSVVLDDPVVAADARVQYAVLHVAAGAVQPVPARGGFEQGVSAAGSRAGGRACMAGPHATRHGGLHKRDACAGPGQLLPAGSVPRGRWRSEYNWWAAGKPRGATPDLLAAKQHHLQLLIVNRGEVAALRHLDLEPWGVGPAARRSGRGKRGGSGWLPHSGWRCTPPMRQLCCP
jgi:hypothetical protein